LSENFYEKSGVKEDPKRETMSTQKRELYVRDAKVGCLHNRRGKDRCESRAPGWVG